jgi:hypothetical protein
MPKPTRLTRAQYERELREHLAKTTVEVGDLTGTPNAAVLIFGDKGKPDRIIVDPFLIGILTAVIHEMWHRARYGKLVEWGQLEETVVEAIEADLAQFITGNPRRLAWWRRAIERKLNASDRGAA